MSRKIVELRWARETANPWPPAARKGRSALDLARRRGLGFEALLAKTLPEAEHNPWFAFADANGPGYCSPDFVLTLPWGLAVLEAKHSFKFEAFDQLRDLYLPVLGMARARHVVGVVVCKTLTPVARSTTIVASLPEALSVARKGTIPVLHWLGRGKLA